MFAITWLYYIVEVDPSSYNSTGKYFSITSFEHRDKIIHDYSEECGLHTPRNVLFEFALLFWLQLDGKFRCFVVAHG